MGTIELCFEQRSVADADVDADVDEREGENVVIHVVIDEYLQDITASERDVRRSPRTVRFTVHCSLFTVHCSLFTLQSNSRTVSRMDHFGIVHPRSSSVRRYVRARDKFAFDPVQ